MSWVLGDDGSIQLPSLILLVSLAFGGFGAGTFLLSWNRKVSTQLRLNRCVGVTSLILQTTLNQLDELNGKIEILRLQTSDAGSDPPLSELMELVEKQEHLLSTWNRVRNHWTTQSGCPQPTDVADPLPELLFVRLPPDSSGFQPLKWNDAGPGDFHIELSAGSRATAAVLRKTENGWQPEWN